VDPAVAAGPTATEQDRLDDGVVVDGVGDGVADPGVSEWSLAVVEVQVD
jgi:hypothetical protein